MAEDMETSERFKRAYEHGRECGEHIRKFNYDPDKDTKTAMQNYIESADDSCHTFMYENGPAWATPHRLCDEWERGFIEGYESIQEEES